MRSISDALGDRRAPPAGLRFRAIAALCVCETTFAALSQAVKLAEIYALTAREVAVLLAIVEHGGVPEVAAILAVFEATLKRHLKCVFSKTGSKRQADLVKLVAGLMSPFIHIQRRATQTSPYDALSFARYRA